MKIQSVSILNSFKMSIKYRNFKRAVNVTFIKCFYVLCGHWTGYFSHRLHLNEFEYFSAKLRTDRLSLIFLRSAISNFWHQILIDAVVNNCGIMALNLCSSFQFFPSPTNYKIHMFNTWLVKYLPCKENDIYVWYYYKFVHIS